jgi:hypothetical protein
MNLTRRQLLASLAVFGGGVLLAPTRLLALSPSPGPLSPAELDLLAELTETIIPTTDTPGAKAAGVPAYIQRMLADCYEETDRQAFREGLAKVEKQAQAKTGKAFTDCSQAEREAIVTGLEKTDRRTPAQAAKRDEKQAAMQQNSVQTTTPDVPGNRENSFPAMLKRMTVTGYFTSEIGATKALDYEHIPGRYKGCAPMKPGQKAWGFTANRAGA